MKLIPSSCRRNSRRAESVPISDLLTVRLGSGLGEKAKLQRPSLTCSPQNAIGSVDQGGFIIEVPLNVANFMGSLRDPDKSQDGIDRGRFRFDHLLAVLGDLVSRREKIDEPAVEIRTHADLGGTGEIADGVEFDLIGYPQDGGGCSPARAAEIRHAKPIRRVAVRKLTD